MDSKNRSRPTDVQELLAEDDPTGESPVLDPGLVAAPSAGPVAGDGVVDPNVLALRRVDAEIRRLMDNWVELENQLHGRDSEILRLREWAGGLEEDLRTTRLELAAARSDCERLRDEVIDRGAEVEEQRRQAEARGAEAESLRAGLAVAQGRISELAAEVRLGKEGTEQLTGRLAEHRDALAGMAAHLRQAEKSSQGLDREKAELAARIVDAEERYAILASRYEESESARRQAEKEGPAAARRARDLEGELEKARGNAVKAERELQEKSAEVRSLEAAGAATVAGLRGQLDAERARVAAMEQVEVQVASMRDALAAAEAAARAAEVERAQLLDQVAGRDAVATELRQRIGDLEGDRAQLLASVQELRDQAAAVDSEFQAKRKAIAVLGNEIDRIDLIQANVRRLDSMMSQQLSATGPAPPVTDKPRNDRLLVWLDGARVMKYPLYKPDMVIGRSRGSDIRVTGSRTSRRHAHIFVEDGAVIVEDLGSLNGITVNSESVRRKELHDGDVVDVGGARLRFVDLDEKAAANRGEFMAAH